MEPLIAYFKDDKHIYVKIMLILFILKNDTDLSRIIETNVKIIDVIKSLMMAGIIIKVDDCEYRLNQNNGLIRDLTKPKYTEDEIINLWQNKKGIISHNRNTYDLYNKGSHGFFRIAYTQGIALDLLYKASFMYLKEKEVDNYAGCCKFDTFVQEFDKYKHYANRFETSEQNNKRTSNRLSANIKLHYG